MCCFQTPIVIKYVFWERTNFAEHQAYNLKIMFLCCRIDEANTYNWTQLHIERYRSEQWSFIFDAWMIVTKSDINEHRHAHCAQLEGGPGNALTEYLSAHTANGFPSGIRAARFSNWPLKSSSNLTLTHILAIIYDLGSNLFGVTNDAIQKYKLAQNYRHNIRCYVFFVETDKTTRKLCVFGLHRKLAKFYRLKSFYWYTFGIRINS